MSQLNAAFMSIDSKYEVQRNNHFRFVIDLNDLQANNNTGVSNGEIIELACNSIGLPNITKNAIDISYGNSKVHVAGEVDIDNISLQVNDFIEPDVEGILYEWARHVYDPKTGKIGWAVNYKKNATVVQYGPNGEVKRKWALQGVWPTNIDGGEMNYEGSEKKQITMDLQVDNAYIIRDSDSNPNHIYSTDPT